MTLAAERRSSSKLYWCVTISLMLPSGNRHRYSAFLPPSIILSSCGKSRANLFSHLHSQLQLYRLLGTYASLNIPLQPINETQESFHIIAVTTLPESLTKAHNIVSHITLLHPFGQRLTHLEHLVCWLEVR